MTREQSSSRAAIVSHYWEAFQARDWAAARSLLCDDALLSWPVTSEAVAGADGIIRLNAIYPEGWTIRIIRVGSLVDGSIYSIVHVNHPPGAFFSVSFFSFRDQLIRMVEEYWSTVEPPPSWRTAELIPGYTKA